MGGVGAERGEGVNMAGVADDYDLSTAFAVRPADTRSTFFFFKQEHYIAH